MTTSHPSRTRARHLPALRRSTGVGITATAAAALAMSLASMSPATAAAEPNIPCSGVNFHCDDTGYGARAHQSFWLMAAGHNCTNYVAWRMIRDGMPRKTLWLHDAESWARSARKHGYLVNDQPLVGAVAQWTTGSPDVSQAGHVAYVKAVTAKSITIVEDNYPSGPLRVRVIPRKDPHWPKHFIHFNLAKPGVAAEAGHPTIPGASPIAATPAVLPMTAGFPKVASFKPWTPAVAGGQAA
ncbi:MAG: CHAP domain-containing protein [Candidatus Nanopelagicales bacterium]|nr:CHAP domain-containing protein [Candidatus Nanopelagicales bacterium]